MIFSKLLLGAAVVAVSALPLVAQQQAPAGFYQDYCAKVNPGQWANAEAFIGGSLSKFTQSGVDSGAIASALTLRTVMPRGSSAPCDYVHVVFYKGQPTPDMSPAELTEALHKAGVEMTAEQYNAKLSELFTLVGNGISQNQSLVGSAKNGDYLVTNSIAASDVGACVAYEKKVWQPLAEEMVKTGKLDAWGVDERAFPAGTNDLTPVTTVDIYPSYEAFINQFASISETWKTVHPDMDINLAFQQFGKLCPREHTVLYKIVQETSPAK